MDDKTQGERLEQELRFLKESFEAEVISKEEFEKGKTRIEQKLNEINQSPSEPNDTEFFDNEAKKIEPIGANDKISKEQNQSEKSDDNKENKLFKYAVVFLVLALAAFFSYSLLNSNKDTNAKNADIKFTIACSVDEDCMQSGKSGACMNPGKKDAKCEFQQEQKINVIVLTDHKECFNCNAERIMGILENWLGPVNAKEIDYSTDEGKKLAELIEARLLPAYVLEGNITNNAAFEQYKSIFVKKNNYYVLGENAAGSTFYFKRENIPNKLDLFAISGDAATARAENNLKEFLNNFKDVKFANHLSTDSLSQELGIKNFPAFLVNNKVKFTGIQSAETIKENYCKLNKLSACEKSLSKNLI